MNQLTKLFSYNGNEVTFRNSEGVAYVNATQMAKSFDKRPTDWLRFEQAQNFLNELSKVRNHTLTELVIVSKGGSNPGTWMHEDVALEFSRWLSPAFSIWCNDRIKELLSVGMTATPQALEDILTNPDLLIGMATQLKELRASNAEKDIALLQANEIIGKAMPKVQYYEDVIESKTQLTTNIIAQEIGVSAIRLNQMLKERKVIYKQGKQWLIVSSLRNKGLVDNKIHTYKNSKGEKMTDTQMRWTEKGREFIHSLFKN